MIYIPKKESEDGVAKVVYISKDRKPRKIFNALDWLARLITHIPSRMNRLSGIMDTILTNPGA